MTHSEPAREAVAVPVGWKLVPVEPTRAMKDAVSRKVDDFAREHARLFVSEIWQDMLSTSPTSRLPADETIEQEFDAVLTVFDKHMSDEAFLKDGDVVERLKQFRLRWQEDGDLLYLGKALTDAVVEIETLRRATPAPSASGGLEAVRSAALEEAARLIEQNELLHTSGGDELRPRSDGNRNGLSYADAIRKLAALAAPADPVCNVVPPPEAYGGSPDEPWTGRMPEAPAATSGEPITARYTNWRGETAERTFIPHRVFLGSNEWHPVQQLLIEATDCEKGEVRTFAASGFAAPVESAQVKAWTDVLAERRRQVEAEGWTPEHDEENSGGEMAKAAAVYALCSAEPGPSRAVMDEFKAYNSVPFKIRNRWPWSEDWLKPTSRRRDLVKAGALILAEIERLDRASLATDAEG